MNDESLLNVASPSSAEASVLEEHYRQALMMSEMEGLTQKEVAKKEGLSLSGAKSRVQRGREMVKEMLLDCCRFEFDHRGSVMDHECKGKICDKC